jgi:predicted Zn-dependent peptidase
MLKNNLSFNNFLIPNTKRIMKRLSIVCLLLLFAVSVSQAQKQYDELSYPELDNFQKPEVETFTTDNGIKFFMVQDNELPLIDVSVNIRGGGFEVSNDKAGLASITGTVIRSGGTKNHPADSLNTMLENKAASMETGMGFTSGGAGMNVLKEDFDQLLPVFLDILTNPAFPEDKVELAITQAKSAISRRNDNTQQIGIREFQRLIYGENSAYGRNTEYETLNNISREDLVNFHKDNFVAENMMVGVVGDFDTAEMKTKLEDAFGEIPAGEETKLDFPEVNYEPKSTINFISKPDVNQSFVMMGHLGGMRDNPDYAKIQVMNRVLSGGFSGRLMQVVRTELGLAYTAVGQYNMSSFYPGVFYAGVMTKSSTTAEATDAVINEIKRLQNEPISEQELQDTKDQILNSAVFEYDSYEQVLSQQMSNDYRGLPGDAFQQYLDGVRNTTIEDVQNVAKEYLNPENLQILVVGNKEEIGDQLQKYGEVNELDISIPQPGSEEQAEKVEGDAEKGRTLLDQMANAVIAPDTEINSLSASGEVTITQMGQSQKLPVSMKVNYENSSVEQNIQSPQGNLTMSYKDGKGMMTMAGQEKPLPSGSPMVDGLKSELNRSIVAIALKADELKPQFTGTEEMNDTSYNKLVVEAGGKNLTIFLSSETNLPAMIRYQEFNPTQGGQVTVQDEYSNWTSKGGLTYPYKQVSIVGGEQAAEAIYTGHEVNPEK